MKFGGLAGGDAEQLRAALRERIALQVLGLGLGLGLGIGLGLGLRLGLGLGVRVRARGVDRAARAHRAPGEP